MNISVILCTYNRCQSLAKSLESLVASVMPTHIEWEIVVVDNNSSDDTRHVVKHFSESNPGLFRYLFEPRQGKSYALNTAIHESCGEILAFVDDDVAVEQNWLSNLTSVLGDHEWAGSGGRILPPRDFSPPRWLALEGPYNMGGALCAQFDLGENPGELKEAPYGTNMAYRKEAFNKYGTFRTDLGPRPGSEIRNEDTEFGRRLLAGGEKLYYVPSAIVYHSIPSERVRKEFFLDWWFAFGRCHVRERRSPAKKIWGLPRYWFSLPRITFGVLLPQTIQWLLARDPQERFRRKCTAWVTVGTMVEIWSQSLKGQTAASDNSFTENGALS